MPIDVRRLKREREAYIAATAHRGCLFDSKFIDHVIDLYEIAFSALKDRETYASQSKKDKAILKGLDVALTEAQNTYKESLNKLPNWYDETHCNSSLNIENRTGGKTSNEPESLFCAGGYEDIGSTVVLAGPGCHLVYALHSYMICSISHKQCWSVPDSLESIPCSKYHDSMGCLGEKNCLACQSTTGNVLSPSWQTMLQQQHGLLWDRQLPVVHLLKTTTRPLIDHQNSKFKRWHNKLMAKPAVEVLALAGPNLVADSVPLLHQMTEQIRDAFQQLCPSALIRIQEVKATILAPMESSRLCVEGIVEGNFVCLAYLSNLQDYCSGKALRHGSTKENLHVIHGVLCNTAEVMDWMCQHCSNTSSIQLPRRLTDALPCLPQRLEYRRTLNINKKGKRVVTEIVPPAQASTPFMAPTPEQIRAESMTLPPNLLPFYYH